MSASRTVDFKAIREVFATKGMKPRILIRSSYYHDREGFPDKGKSRKNYRYFDGTTLGKVTVSESVSLITVLLVILSVAAIPFGIAIGIYLGLKKSRDARGSQAERIERFKKFAYGSLYISMAIQGPLFFWAKLSAPALSLSDLWCASDELIAIANFISQSGWFALIFSGKWMDRYVAKLKGQEDLKAFDAEMQFQRKIKRPGVIALMVCAIIGLLAFTFVLNAYRQPRPAIIVLLLPILIGLVLMMLLENHMERKLPREPLPPTDETV